MTFVAWLIWINALATKIDTFSSTHYQVKGYIMNILLTLCMLVNSTCFLPSAAFSFFFKINFFKNIFRNTISVSNILDPDQAGYFVEP